MPRRRASGSTGCMHGTHVAGIAAGGPVTTPSALSGVAPAASIIAIQVFTKGTSAAVCGSVGATPCLLAYDSDIDAALDWILCRRLAGDPLYAGLDAVNLSLGGGLFSGSCDTTNPVTTSLIENLRSAGIATVIAAGNNGQSGRPGTLPKMSSPACISSAVSVGATTGSLAGVVASYSNLTADTTILAPGSSVLSSEPGSTYGLLSGTSMATPVVVGAIAAIRERSPATSVDALVTRMQGTGDVVSTPVGNRRQLRVDLAVETVVPNLPAGSPFGSLDVATPDIGAVTVSGWAIDPDTAGAPLVQVSIDGVATAATASNARPDVAAVFPGYGSRHGWTVQLVASPGPHTVCAAAVNAGAGSNALLSCRSVVVLQGPPFGSLDVAAAGIASVNVAGWVIDPDTSDPVQVHVYVDGAAMALVADESRPDVAAAFAGYGPLARLLGHVRCLAGRPHGVCLRDQRRCRGQLPPRVPHGHRRRGLADRVARRRGPQPRRLDQRDGVGHRPRHEQRRCRCGSTRPATATRSPARWRSRRTARDPTSGRCSRCSARCGATRARSARRPRPASRCAPMRSTPPAPAPRRCWAVASSRKGRRRAVVSGSSRGRR